METGLLGQSPTQRLEFTEEDVSQIPLPDELPRPPSTHHLPPEILKSGVIENLISQNEDLMARLKVALRRLSLTEIENQKLSQDNELARKDLLKTRDQMLVLREKDNAWKAKTESLETDREVLAEKCRILESRLKADEAEMARHRKYHERIKSQVKPYLVQLKEYARSLEIDLQSQGLELQKRETLVQDLRRQMSEVVRNSRLQIEAHELKSHELVDSYENSLREMRQELDLLRETNRDLEARAARLRRAEQRADEYENELIELRRSKEETQGRFEKEFDRLMTKTEELSRENAKLRVAHEDLTQISTHDKKRLDELERETLNSQGQLESLRYMWQSLREENESLRLRMKTLEKINVDLSSKIQDVRQKAQEAVAGPLSSVPPVAP